MESPREYYKALCDGPPIELAPGLYQLTIPLPFRLNHVHVYLVEADDGFLLIDTGVNTSEAFSSLKRKLDDIGLDFMRSRRWSSRISIMTTVARPLVFATWGVRRL